MPTRYATEDDYGREQARGIRRERDGRDVRERDVIREAPRERRQPMEVDQPRLARVVEPDLIRGDAQRVANSGIPRQQPDPRPLRNPPPPRDRGDDDMMFDAPPRTGYVPVRDMREPAARRTPYEGEFDDMPPSVRPVIDPGRSRDEPRPNYNEYFLPGEGIDREVIQSEICRYLGQDATCKPGTHDDGRRGYIIRAYRALTTEMIRSLKEDSLKYVREKENAAKRNRQPASFAAIRDQVRYGGVDDMMIDEPDYRERYDEQPRARAPPITSTYMPEPGFPAYYSVPNNQPPPPGVGIDPRMDPRYVPAGNTTPPSGRTPGYNQPYPPGTGRPAQPAALPPAGAYADPRTGAIRDAGHTGYQNDSRPARYR